jgi:hypothetical protein
VERFIARRSPVPNSTRGAVGLAEFMSGLCDERISLYVPAPGTPRPPSSVCSRFLSMDATCAVQPRTHLSAPSLIPPVNGNTVRSFSTHGKPSAAQGSSTTVSALTSNNFTFFSSVV